MALRLSGLVVYVGQGADVRNGPLSEIRMRRAAFKLSFRRLSRGLLSSAPPSWSAHVVYTSRLLLHRLHRRAHPTGYIGTVQRTGAGETEIPGAG